MSSSATMQQAKTEAAQPAQRSSQLATQHQQRNSSAAQSELSDLRPQATAQRQLQDTANNSPQSHQLNTFQQMAQNSARATQLKAMSTMMNAPAVQRVEEDEPLQAKSTGETIQREAAGAAEAPKPNNTGLPDNLKSGVESLSGMSMDHVKVHYNSAQPAQLNAHAYAQGSDIHVAPGQEQHLPHEAWHVVQQAQGRVQPTMQMKAGVPINDDAGLEAEADAMGAKALTSGQTAVQIKSTGATSSSDSQCVQTKMVDVTTNETLVNNGPTKSKFRKAKKTILDHSVTGEWKNILNYRLIDDKEVVDQLEREITGEKITAEIEFYMGSASLLYPNTFVYESVGSMVPDVNKFKVVDPGNATVIKRTSNDKSKDVPENRKTKPVGYVVNLASYYGEKGVNNIAPAYYSDAISGSEDEKGNRLAIVAGLNSFEPVTETAYAQTTSKLDSAVSSFKMPGFAANVSTFGFLWQPQWQKNGANVSIDKLRSVLSLYGDESKVAKEFLEQQNGYKSYLPYGIFRETVTASSQTKSFVSKLSAYNNPVYIHSGDGDSIDLKIPSGEGPELSDTGVLDRYSEALGQKEHNPMLAIGGYNFFRINEINVKSEIVKADSTITDYREVVDKDTKIDKTKVILLDKLQDKDALFVDQRCKQIIHNTQVVNRWDHLIRGAIAKVFPKMLYPTEPNMLIKAKDSKDSFDLFSHDKFKNNGTLKEGKRGTLWGNSASEGRILRENLEEMYPDKATKSGKNFVDWIENASLPTDTRGFDRHFLVSGYEHYPDSMEEKDWPPVYHPPREEIRNKPIPLETEAIQQAQSYTSAARLADMYCRAAEIEKDSKDGKAAKTSFDEIENITQLLMSGQTVEISTAKGTGVPGEIVLKIKEDFLAKFGVD